jgi:hypothetical protein
LAWTAIFRVAHGWARCKQSTSFGLIVLSVLFGLSACTTAETADRDAASDSAVAREAREKVTVPTGTPIRIVLQNGVGSDTSTSGSEFSAVLAEPVTVNGKTVLEKGSAVVGRVTDVKKSGRVKGRASISLTLTSLERDGKSVPVATKTYVGVAKSTRKRDVAVIGGAAGVGAAIGAIVGGGKGAATGAAIGGAGGTGTVLATRGDDVHFPPESRLRFVLSNPIDL